MEKTDDKDKEKKTQGEIKTTGKKIKDRLE